MKTKAWLPVIILLALLVAACSGESGREAEPPEPTPEDPNATMVPPGADGEEPINPYAPGKGDESLQRGEAFIEAAEILILESFPPQFRLQVIGALPTPCHSLRAVVEAPDEQNEIHVEIYSLVDPEVVCAQVLEPFEASIPLGRDLQGASYTVFINGQQVGEITPVPQPQLMTPPGDVPATPVQ
jgi:hypothetical protein